MNYEMEMCVMEHPPSCIEKTHEEYNRRGGLSAFSCNRCSTSWKETGYGPGDGLGGGGCYNGRHETNAEAVENEVWPDSDAD